MARKALLDVNPSLLTKNLLLKPNSSNMEDPFLSYLMNEQDESLLKDGEKMDINGRCRLVKPVPGFCIKTWKDRNVKFFINVCHTDHIPQPNPITDFELMQLLYQTDNTPNQNFRIPMSIGNLHMENDKSGHPCEVCDVAVNSDFYHSKVMLNAHFKSFVITLALEGVIDKYNVNIDREKEPILLKHCQVMGKIENQTVQIREHGNSRYDTSSDRKTALIQEMTGGGLVKPTPGLIEDQCMYQMMTNYETTSDSKRPSSITVNIVVNRPDITRAESIALDIGEDRLLIRTEIEQTKCLQNPASKILLDLFLPYDVDSHNGSAHFNTDNKVLTVHLPVAMH